MEYMKLKEYWLSEEKKIFKGWDFSYIGKRKFEESLPWNYDVMVHEYLNINSMASYLLKIGVTMKEIPVWLGHSDISTTMNISHVDIEMKKNAAKKINDLFTNVSYN